LLWGYALEFWDRVGIVSLIVGAIVGVIALLLTAASAYILYRVADAAQLELAAETKRSSEGLAAIGLETAKAKAALGVAQADIAKANAQIALANEGADQARAEQERLKAQLAWRRVTKELYDRIVVAVRTVKLDGPLDVAFPLGDVEAATLAADLIKALKAGGIAIKGDGASAAAFMPVPPTGIIVGQPGTEMVAQPFAQALASAGIPIAVEVGTPELKLVVGSKPSPF
jgi:hypothetical protein